MNLQQLKKRTQLGNSGFSLVELIIVIAIMAILIAVLAPMFIRYVERSRISRDVNAAGQMVQALKTLAADPTLVWGAGTTDVQAVWVPAGTVTLTPGGAASGNAIFDAFTNVIPLPAVASSRTFEAATNITMTVNLATGAASASLTTTATDSNTTYMSGLIDTIG